MKKYQIIYADPPWRFTGLGRRGKVKPVKHNIRQLTEAVSEGHSVKPAIIRDKIVELMGDLP